MKVPDIVQETGIKMIPKKNKCKQAKSLSEEALHIAVERREVKSKGEKERYTDLNAEFQRISRGDKNQDNHQEKKMQRSKMAVWVGLTISCEKKSETQRRKEVIYSFEGRVP